MRTELFKMKHATTEEGREESSAAIARGVASLGFARNAEGDVRVGSHRGGDRRAELSGPKSRSTAPAHVDGPCGVGQGDEEGHGGDGDVGEEGRDPDLLEPRRLGEVVSFLQA